MADLRTQLPTGLANHYTLEHELGEGGMATVFLAQGIHHERKVAVNVLRPELADSLRDRLAREKQLPWRPRARWRAS